MITSNWHVGASSTNDWQEPDNGSALPGPVEHHCLIFNRTGRVPERGATRLLTRGWDKNVPPQFRR